MTREPRRKSDARGEATRIALIEAAESLFAQGGVEAVSTRQIGAAIGSSNTNVVAYHFGSKDALIREVYRHRLPRIDARRGALLEEAKRAGTAGQTRALMRVFFLPLFEQTDPNGQHSYARFLSGLERSGLIGTRTEVNTEFPLTEDLFLRLRDSLDPDVRPSFARRIRLVTALIASALHQIDLDAVADRREAVARFEEALAMAAQALGASTGD